MRGMRHCNYSTRSPGRRFLLFLCGLDTNICSAVLQLVVVRVDIAVVFRSKPSGKFFFVNYGNGLFLRERSECVRGFASEASLGLGGF